MSKIDDRVVELEVQTADLRAEVADLRAQLAASTPTRPAPVTPVMPPRPKPKAEEGEVRVTYPSAHNPTFTMPSEAQLHELLDIVVRKYPILRAGISKSLRFADQDEQAFFNEYEAAFRALGTVNRTPDGVDERHGADHWVRIVQDRLHGGTQTLHVLPLVAAIIGHSDIPYVINLADMTSCSFGLRGDEAGVAASDRWRHTLAVGMARESLPLPRQRPWSMGMQVNGAR